MNDKVPHLLREMIRNTRSCLVVGAGVSVAASRGHECSSWKGLLKNGIRHCETYCTQPLDSETANKLVAVLDSGDTDNWLALATVIERKLGYPNNTEWNSWLYENVGGIRVKNKNIVEAILGLEVPILTTNYDGIFSDRSLSCPRKSLTWKDNFSAVHFTENPLEYIFHLHGSYLQAESVVLGVSSYEKLLHAEFIQYMQRLFSLSYGFVFVGYGSGFEDPNFSALLNFIDKYGALSPSQRHFVLVKEGDQDLYRGVNNLYPVVYGDKFEDLPVFIRSLPFGYERYLYRSRRRHAESIGGKNPFRDMAYCPELMFLPAWKGDFKVKENVNIRVPFAIGRYPVTVDEWDIFVQENGSYYKKFVVAENDAILPITGVTHYDAEDYCKWLSEITGYKYRLPSENEWEYAATGGSKCHYWWGDNPDIKYANYRDSGLGCLSAVNAYPPNKFNLKDMFGNAWEWTSDHYKADRVRTNYDESPFETKAKTREEASNERVLKGGCFYYKENDMKASSRIHLERHSVFNSVGFRVVREVDVLLEDGCSYFVVSISSAFAIDGNGSRQAPVLSNFDMRQSQKWVVSFVDQEVITLTNKVSGKVIFCPEGAEDYTKMKLCDSSEENTACESGKFYLKKILGGYMLVSVTSGKAVDLEGARTEVTPDLIVFEPHGNFNQGWNFIPA